MDHDQQLRQHAVYLLQGGGAHLDFEKAIDGLPPELRGRKPASIPHSPWRLLEHMRICQWDILEYTRNLKHVSPDFPDGYWPQGDAPPSNKSWDLSVEGFRLGNWLVEKDVESERTTGVLQCRERLGGLLKYYHRNAA